jgi:hypothetical protein
MYLRVTTTIACFLILGCAKQQTVPIPMTVAPSVLDEVIADGALRGAGAITKLTGIVPANADAVGAIDLTSFGPEAEGMMGGKTAMEAMQKDLKAVFGKLLGSDLSKANYVLGWMRMEEQAIGLVLDGKFRRGKLKGKNLQTVAGVKALKLEKKMLLAAIGPHMVVGNEAGISAMVAVHKRKRPALGGSKVWTEMNKGLALVQGSKPVVLVSVGRELLTNLTDGSPLKDSDFSQFVGGIGRDLSVRVAVRGSVAARKMLEAIIEKGREQGRLQAEETRQQALESPDLIEAVGGVVVAHSVLAGLHRLGLTTEGDALVGQLGAPDDAAMYVAVTSVLAVVALPAFIKYQRRALTVEAIDQMDKIYKGAAIYYTTPHINARGEKLPCQFPASQGVTPRQGTCCSTGGFPGPDANHDDRCDSDPDVWNTDTWSSLNFQMTGEHYFVYSFESSGVMEDAGFTVTANADLDCDGTMSTFQRMGFGDPQASKDECSLRGSAAFYVEKETE